MPRPSADYNTRTKGARAKLEPRAKPYYRHIAPNKTLGYVRRDGAAGSWVVREWEGGAYRFRTLGAADDIATADGRDVLTFDQALQAGSKARAVQPVGHLTVDQALNVYFDALAGRSKHAKHYRAVAAKHISPELGRRRVDRLTKTELEAWQAGLVDDDEDDDDPEARRRSQDTANRILTILKAALNAAFADEANQIPSDAAWRRVSPFQGVARARQVDMDATEVRTLIAKASKLDKALAVLLEAAYLTGARMGELAGASVRDLDAARSTLRVDGKTGPRIVTLTNEAAAFLKKQTSSRLPDAPLLPDAEGARWIRAPHRDIKRAASGAELSPDTCVYSLRHAHASRAIEAGMPLSLLAENLGTSLLMLQRNYAHVLARTRRDVVQQTGPKLRRVK